MAKWPEDVEVYRKSLERSEGMSNRRDHHAKHQGGRRSMMFLTTGRGRHLRLFATCSGGLQLDDQYRDPFHLHDVFVGGPDTTFHKAYDVPNGLGNEPVQLHYHNQVILATYAAWFLLQELGRTLVLPSFSELRRRPADRTDMTRVTAEAFRFLRDNVQVQLRMRAFPALSDKDIRLADWDRVLLGRAGTTWGIPVDLQHLQSGSVYVFRYDVCPTFLQNCRPGEECYSILARTDFMGEAFQPTAICSVQVAASRLKLAVSDVYGVHMLRVPHTKALTTSAIRASIVTELFQTCPKSNFWPLDIATHQAGLVTFLPTKREYLQQLDNLKFANLKPVLHRALHRIKTQLAR
jgi:hypothetical protein